MKKNSIVYLKRTQLEPHPDNPRKDLGDLEELRESIRANGIMQNLTVIPTNDSLEHFRILIGHRRFAASEGILSELPCVIVENLTDREQVGIMLCENLQRNDLTFYEQGQGFQMMLDLGDTVDDIVEKTGFSKTTVKHRLEVAKLPKTSLENRSFQITITDLIELEKVKDIKKRQKILAEANSHENLTYKIRAAVREQKIKEGMDKLKPWLKKLCVKPSKQHGLYWSSDYEQVFKIDLEDIKDISFEKMQKTVTSASKGKNKPVELIYEESYGTLYVLKKSSKSKTAKKEKSEWEIKKEKKRANRKQIKLCHEAYCKSVFEFLELMPDGDIDHGVRDYYPKVWELLVKSEADLQRDIFSDFFKDEQEGKEFYDEFLPERPMLWQMLFFILYTISEDDFCDYSNRPKDKVLDLCENLTTFISKLGYNLPDDIDVSILDGTSALYEEASEEKA